MKPGSYLLIAAILEAIIFAVDISIPLGVAFGVTYIIVILITLQTPYRNAVIFAAVISTLLVLLGLVYSPEGGEAWKIYFNRVIAIVAIWIVVLLGLIKNKKEELLRQSESELKEAQRTANLGIIRINFLDSSVWWSDDLYRCLGLEKDEVILTNDIFFEHIHTDDVDRVREAIEKIRQTESTEALEVEYRVMTGNSDELHIHAIFTPRKDPTGRTISCMGVCQGITERKQAEAEREKLLHDKGERIKELQCMYGVAKSIQSRTTLEEIFQDVTRLIPPGWHYPEITRGKVTFDGEEYVSEPFEETEWKQSSDIMVDGDPRGSIEVYYLEERPELDEGPFMTEERNLINGISISISEAIERRLAEEALRDSNERFRASFADASTGMALVSLGHSIIEANQAYCNMLGYTKDEIIGTFFKDITHPDDVDKSYNYHRKLIAGEIDNYHFEKRYVHKQGHEIWALLSASLVRDKDATPLYSIAQIQDITELKWAEEELRKVKNN
jgi:PAS domain S-box-containing protein